MKSDLERILGEKITERPPSSDLMGFLRFPGPELAVEWAEEGGKGRYLN